MEFDLEKYKFNNKMKSAVCYSKLLTTENEFKKEILEVLKGFDITPNDAFFKGVGFAIGTYLYAREFKSQAITAKKNFRLIKNATQKLENRINQTDTLSNNMIGMSNLTDLVRQLGNFKSKISIKNDELEKMTKRAPYRSKDKDKHSLFISVADSIEKHLDCTPKKTREGIFEQTMVVILGFTLNRRVEDIHKTAMNTLDERNNKEHFWGTLIELKSVKNISVPFLISSFDLKNKK